MKMRNPPRRGRHFAPTVHQNPTDKATRRPAISVVASERLEKKRNVLPERIKLVPQRLARTKKVTADLAIAFDHKRRFRLPIGVVSCQKIREQLSIFVNGI